MIKRTLLVAGVLGLMTTLAWGSSYQRTRDGKTMVWNNDPKPGDEATWSGDRDAQGYASGFGTLTWYIAEKKGGTTIYARYFGNMVRGKFSGPINVHSKGKTGHAVFAEGERTTRWVRGPAPSSRMAEAAKSAKPAPEAEPAAPAEGSTARAKPSAAPPRPTPSMSEVSHPAADAPITGSPLKPAPAGDEKLSAKRSVPNASPAKKIGPDDSLQALIAPPSSLRSEPEPPPPTPAPETGPRLSKEEVTELADAETRTRGYDPDACRRGEAEYNATDKTWSLSYEQRAVDGTEEPPKRFNVVIDDKTKGRVFLLGK